MTQAGTGTGWVAFFRKVVEPIEGPPEASAVLIGIGGVLVPVGSRFRFVVPPGQTSDWTPFPGLDSGDCKVTSPGFTTVNRVEWPANVVTDMTIYWSANGTTPAPGMSITPSVVVENA
jgi:hypothetical protein